MKLQTIEKSDFAQIDGSRQVIAHDHARRFAVLDLGSPLGRYGLSWRSSLVEPIVELSPNRVAVWIGVDQQLVSICLHQGRICVSLTLNTNVLQILAMDNLTTILTEDEVLLFNPDSSIRLIKGLPGLAQEISLVNTDLVIKLMQGKSLTLDSQTGILKIPG